MALRIHVLLYKNFFVPGERVSCTVQVYNDGKDSAVAAQVKELQFSSTGIERTDTHWIKHLHRNEIPADASTEPRKRTRNIYKTVSVPLLQDAAISTGSAHQFHVRFRLPLSLPPTFKGQSCRFSYMLEVKAIYSQQLAGSIAPTNYETVASTVLTVWPPAMNSSGQLLGSAPSGQLSLGQPLRSATSQSLAQQQQAQQRQQSGSVADGLNQEPSQALGNHVWAPPDDRSARSSSTGEPAASRLGTPFALPGNGPAADGTALPPVVDYPLRQNIKVRWKEVPVDYSLLQGQLNIVLPHATAPDSPSRTVPISPSPSPSTSNHSLSGGPVIVQHRHHHYDPRQPQSHSHHDGLVNLTTNATSTLQAIRSTQSMALEPQLHHRISSGNMAGPVIDAPQEPLSPAVVAAAAALEQYRASARLAAVTRGQLLGHTGSSSGALLQSGSSSSSSSGDEGGGKDEVGARRGDWQRRGSGTGGRSARLQSALSLNDSIATRNAPSVFGHTFSLQLREHTILRILLQAPLDSPLQPGASFGGLIELRPGGLVTPPAMLCHHLTVLLESEEVVDADHSARGGSRRPGVMRRLHCEHQELTSDLAVTNFLFSIPAGATPSFETPMVSLRWVLHFELMIGAPLPLMGASTGTAAKATPAFEQMLWSLPLHVQTPI